MNFESVLISNSLSYTQQEKTVIEGKISGVCALSLPKPVLHNIKLTQKMKNPLYLTLLKGHSINLNMH